MANTIIGVGLFAAAVIAGMIANFQFMELTFEIDQHLPNGQNDSIWWTPVKHLRAWRLQKQFLPGSRRVKTFKLLLAIAFSLMIGAMAVLTAKPF